MKRVFCSLLALIIFICDFSQINAYAAYKTLIRVGLAYGSSAVYSANIKSSGGFKAGQMVDLSFSGQSDITDTDITIQFKDNKYVVSNKEGKIVFETSSDNIAIRAKEKTITYNGNSYYGDFVFKANTSSKLTVMNYVNIEDYVKGVLPYEMSASWPIEALKAQAVCARSYVLGTLDKHKKYGFDVCNTTNCQVYNGTSRADKNSNEAVEQTKGEILTSNGKLAVGYFFSSSGGATENNENVWGGKPISYLRGVQDIYEDASGSSKNIWTVTLTAQQVQSKLKSAGYKIGQVANVSVTKRTEMGNVNEVTVIDTEGNTVKIKNGDVRTVFGLNSIRYTINGDKPEVSLPQNSLYINGVSSKDENLYAIGANKTIIKIDKASGKTALTASGKQTISTLSKETYTRNTSDTYTFSGTGWGHNVGMSQYGARSMAKMGFLYQDILKFYFKDIQIENIFD